MTASLKKRCNAISVKSKNAKPMAQLKSGGSRNELRQEKRCRSERPGRAPKSLYTGRTDPWNKERKAYKPGRKKGCTEEENNYRSGPGGSAMARFYRDPSPALRGSPEIERTEKRPANKRRGNEQPSRPGERTLPDLLHESGKAFSGGLIKSSTNKGARNDSVTRDLGLVVNKHDSTISQLISDGSYDRRGTVAEGERHTEVASRRG